MSDNYILIGQTAVPCPDIHEWAQWFEHNDRRVGFTKVFGICYVSTVFLGIDHNFSHRYYAAELRGLASELGIEDPTLEDLIWTPILFESMTFWSGGEGEEQARCSTWSEAEAMHKRMVAEVSRPRAVLGYAIRVLLECLSGAKQDWQERWRELRGKSVQCDDPAMAAAMESMDKSEAARESRLWELFG